MKHDYTGDDLTKLYHGTQHLIHVMEKGLEPRPVLSNKEMLGESVTKAVFLTPDPAEAMKYLRNVVKVDARDLDLELIEGPEGWNYFSEQTIPVDRLEFLDAQGLINALNEYAETV